MSDWNTFLSLTFSPSI